MFQRTLYNKLEKEAEYGFKDTGSKLYWMEASEYFRNGLRESYEIIADICLKTGIKGVLDVNCGYGLQSMIFADAHIPYVGIDDVCESFMGDTGEAGVCFYHKSPNDSIWPFFSGQRFAAAICRSWNCYLKNKDELEQAYEMIFVCAKNAAKQVFPANCGDDFMLAGVFQAKGDDLVLFFVNKNFDKKVWFKAQCRNILTAAAKPNLDAEKKYQISGIQFPGENGITRDGINFLLSKNSGIYLDFHRVDGNCSSAIFAIDSDLFAEWEERGAFESFDYHIKNILDDMGLESDDNTYNIFGTEAWFGYEPDYSETM